MKTVKLTKRLNVIAGYIQNGEAVIDIGTDHGYIPIYLAQNGIARSIVATDLREGPLERAKTAAREYGVAERIEFVQTDGLSGIHGIGIDTVVLAGMGGETIAAILEKAQWLLVSNVRLILQPQSKLDVLSSWIDRNGCAIFDETLVEDDGRIYAVLLAGAGKSRAPFSCAELYADRILTEKRDPLLPRYLDTLITKTTKEIKGLELSDRRARSEELMHKKEALEGFIRMKKETVQW
jgi:tRNA (adenine22-N1)-methyltransferase